MSATSTSRSETLGTSVVDEAPPPVGEEIHLPGPSFLPLAVAIGITMCVVSTTIWGWVLAVPGIIIFLVSTGLWIRDTRRDIDALPEEHHGPA